MFEDCKKFSPILFVWLAASTIIYLFIFWSRFGVNPVDYISVGELINYAGQYFFVAAGVSIFIGGFELIFPKCVENKNYGSDLFVIRLSLSLITMLGWLSIYFKDSYPAISALFYAPLLTVSWWLSTTEVAKQYIPTHAVRLSALIFIFLSPYFAISESLTKSNNILHEINVKKACLHGIEEFPVHEVIYIGRLGEYIFYKKIGSQSIFEIKLDEIKYKEYAL